MKYWCITSLFLVACASGSPEDNIRYQPFSTSVINVTFYSAPEDTIFLKAFTMNYIPRAGQKSERIPVTGEGSYYMSLTNDRPTSAFLDLGNDRYNIIIFPGDTVGVDVKILGEEFKLSFSGKGAAINEYYLAKKNQLAYTDIRVPLNAPLNSSASYQLILATTDSVVGKERNFLRNYLREKPLPEWFVHHEQAEIEYAGAGFKIFRPKYNELFSIFEDQLPDQYYAFLNDVLINNPEAITSGNYLQFLDDYFMQDLPSDEFNGLAGLEKHLTIGRHTLPLSQAQLSGEVQDVYHRYKFSSILKYLSDSATIDFLAKVYQVTEYQSLLKIIETKATLRRGDTIPNFYVVDQLDSLVSFRTYRDKIVYVNFWAVWCKPCIKNIPELNRMITSYADQDDVLFLNVCLDSDQDKWLASLKRYNLRGTNVLAEGQWNQKLRASFSIEGIPNYALVAQGNVLYENHTNKAPAVKRTIDDLIEVNDLQ
ncbi:MAG: TlpA disulfide reductase family protein [Tunicatimonas sp.]